MPAARRTPQQLSSSPDIDHHVALIQRMVAKSMKDGETRQLAVRIVSGAFDYVQDPATGQDVAVVEGYGRNFRAPTGPPCASRDERCEVDKMWDFVVLNFRYVYDPAEVDTFATARESLLAGGGDCDDAVILFSALLGMIGFRMVGRVISTKADPETWVHIYPLVGMTKDDPSTWLPLDMTVEGATPGWEYEEIANSRDYVMV